MLKCAACGKFISTSGTVSCSVCPSIFHKGCVSLSETASVSKEWACPDCKKRVRKGDNTPVRSVYGGQSLDTGVGTQVTASRATAASRAAALPAAAPPALAMPPTAEVQDLRRELAECLVEMREFRREMADFRISVAGISARMDGLEQRLEAVEQRRTEPVPDVAELELTIAQLKLELNERDQEVLLSDLEIGHLPEEKGENVLHVVTVLAAKLGVALEERDVVFAERVGVAPVAGSAGEAPRARRVVVRLARRHLRDQLLQAARVRRTLTTADAGRGTSTAMHGRIFLNERLSRLNRQLFHQVREECRRLQWRFSWTKRGRIFARQGEGKPVHSIRSEADVRRVFGPIPV